MAKTIQHVGLDVHAETIALAITASHGQLRSYGNVPAHTVALDKLHRRNGATDDRAGTGHPGGMSAISRG